MSGPVHRPHRHRHHRGPDPHRDQRQRRHRQPDLPATATTNYTYDANGNRLTAADGSQTITSTYDRLNRPLSVTVDTDAGGGTTYTYSLTSPTWTDPTGTYTATLDKFDRQIALVDPVHGAAAMTWSYRADGQPATMAAQNGNTTAYAYNALGRATSLVTTAAGPVTRARTVEHRDRQRRERDL